MTKKAQILVEAQDMTKTALQSVERNLKSVNEASNSLAMSFQSVLAATGAATLGRAMLTNAMQAEQASNRLDAVLKATGNAAGFAKNELDAMADSLAASTQFDDESIRGAQATFLKFGNVTGSVFSEGMKLAADYAAFIGTEIPDAAQVIGKALSSPVEGIGALEKQIGKLRPEQEAMIKGLVEQGRVMEAQSVVLDILRSKIGGTAEIMNTGLTQATSGAKKAWDELLETMGKTEAIGGRAERALKGTASLLSDIRDTLEGKDNPLAALIRDMADEMGRLSAVLPLPLRLLGMGVSVGARSLVPAAGRGGDAYENSFDSGAMNRALTPRPGRVGSGGAATKSKFDQAVEAMTKESAAAGAITKLEQIGREIELGVFGKLTTQQQERLKGLALEIDLQKKKKEAIETTAKTQKSLVDDVLKENRENKEAVDAIVKKNEDLLEKYRDQVDPTRALKRELIEIERLMALNPEHADELQTALGRVKLEIGAIQNANENYVQLHQMDGIKSEVDELVEALAGWGRGFSRTFAQAVVDADFSFKRMGASFNDLLADIAAAQIDKRFTQPIIKAGGSLLDKALGSVGASAGSWFGSLFQPSSAAQTDAAMFGSLPARAGGGPVSANQTYLVGERGPELFKPGSSGNIIPNGAAGGVSMMVNPQFNVVVPDTRSFAQWLGTRESRQMITGVFNDAMRNAGRLTRIPVGG